MLLQLSNLIIPFHLVFFTIYTAKGTAFFKTDYLCICSKLWLVELVVWHLKVLVDYKQTHNNILNTTSITGETLIHMNIKHYMYNLWNIDIHEYQTLQV